MNFAVRLVISFLFLPAISFAYAAEQSPVSVKSEIDKASITIGDPVLYTVTISHAPNVQILSAIPYPPEDLFEIRKVEEFKDEEGSRAIAGKRFTITAFQLGEYILEPVKVEYRLEGGDVKSIETNKIFITVKSVGGDKDAQDIKDVKSAIRVPRNVTGLIVTIGAGALAILFLLLFRLFKKKPLRIVKPEKILSPEEEATLHLNQLFDSDLVKQGKIKEYFFQFSDILRIYLEKRFKVAAVEQTTFEILQTLKESAMPQENGVLLREILEAADLAKFAKWKPEPAETIALNLRAREFIGKSIPKVAPSEEEKESV